MAKIPFKYGSKPVQAFNLDDKNDRTKLGIQKYWNIDPAKPPKRADRYVRYSNGKHGVVELKPSLLKKAPDQLKSSANMLVNEQKPVDYLIVVLEDLGSFERENLYSIKKGSAREQQVNNMWVGDNKLFGGS